MISVYPKEIPPSKSLYNRALILQTFIPHLMISSESEFISGDASLMQIAVDDFAEGKKEFNCGAGAAPLRFFAIRLSREEGSFTLNGSERLFARPQQDLVEILQKLGCENIKLGKDSLTFDSKGQWPTSFELSPESTSQVLSGILLASWDLPEESVIEIHTEKMPSKTYAEMTLNLMMQMGWQGKIEDKEGKKFLTLPKAQQPAIDEIILEPDMSCVAALALMGALDDGIRFWSIPHGSLQGDAAIFSILKEMGVKIIENETDMPEVFINLRVEKATSFKGIEVDLNAIPDLFPVLAAFCSFATTNSKLKGLGHLNSKESRRLDRMRDLLTSVGVKCEIFGDDFVIHPSEKINNTEMAYDPDQDHRLAMAAAVLNLRGAKLKIKTPEVVEKSFPNFWSFFKN